MCLLCKRNFLGETWLSLKEAVSQLAVPALLVDAKMMVHNVSPAATALVDKIAYRGKPMLAGVVIACANSKLPGGCGQTDLCLKCVLRNTATATFADGITRRGFETAHTLTANGTQRDVIVTFSVEKSNDGVLIYIDDVRDQAEAVV